MPNYATTDELSLLVIKTLKDGKKLEFQQIILELQPYDIAEIYREIPDKHHARFLIFLNVNQIAELLEELEKEEQLEVLRKLGAEKSGDIMNLMANNELAFLLEDLEPEQIEALFEQMETEKTLHVQNNLNYPAESAGRLMTNRFIWIKKDYTVKQTVTKLRSFIEFSGTINYLYVVDSTKKLVGVVSYRDLIIADENEIIEEIMYTRVISVSTHTDQEEIASLIERYDFVAIPVVEEQVLVGIITVDAIIDVVIEEATEDIQKLSASGKSIDFDTRALSASYQRLPWLILLLFIGLISGTILKQFEHTLSEAVALVFFMPMIAGMTGNTGTQSLAIVVRGLVTRDVNKSIIVSLILRELRVGILIGVTCGTLISLIAYFWQGNPVLGIVVGVSLIATLIIGTLAGTVIPIILYNLKLDPAVASGPLITTLNDILSLLIYLGIATAFLSSIS